MELKDLMDPLDTYAPSINEVAGEEGFNADHLIMWTAKLWLSEHENPEDLPDDEEKFHNFLWKPVPVVEVDWFEYACNLMKAVEIETVKYLLDLEKFLAGDNVHLSIQQITRDVVLSYLENHRDCVLDDIKGILTKRSAQ